METTKPRVLVADDEAHIRTLMKTVVKGLGFDLAGEAANGQQALEEFLRTRPEIVLLDINMPIKSGSSVLKEIMAAAPDAFVIMLTSVVDADSISECLSYGAASYIRKDTPLANIKSIITEAWAGRSKSGGQ